MTHLIELLSCFCGEVLANGLEEQSVFMKKGGVFKEKLYQIRHICFVRQL